jgi:hypothetical protein
MLAQKIGKSQLSSSLSHSTLPPSFQPITSPFHHKASSNTHSLPGSFTDNSTVPTDGAIRNRIQHLRKDHRAVYEGAGLTWPGTTGGGGGGEKTSTPVKKPATPAKKRSAKTMKGDDENDENDDGDKTPVPKKQKIKTEVVDIEPEGLLGYSSE